MYCIVIGMSFGIYLPNFVVIGRLSAELRRHIDFSRVGHRVGNLLPGSGLVTVSIYEGGNLSACEIFTRYLNPRLRQKL